LADSSRTEISGLETSIDYYKREIEKDEEQLKQLNSGDKNLEKFAREQYYLAGPGESIFLIEIPKELE
jgi:cell division protein DivIC